METIFAVVLGLVAAWGLWGAVRSARSSGRVAAGYGLVAAAAIIQIINILGPYSILLSVLTTLGLIGGVLLARRPPARPAPSAP